MMVESFLANGPACNGGDRYQVVVNVDAGVLADDADGVCELDNAPAIAAETARRLMCDASILVVTDGKGGRVEIGKKAPAIPASTRRAVRRRDQGCRFPGCGARVFTHVHHIRHRARHGTNDLTNLIELCWHHHRLVHEGGWNLRLDTNGDVLAIRPNGNVLPRVRPVHLGDQHGIERGNCQRGITIDPTTCIPRWYGDRLDLDHIITSLLSASINGQACRVHPDRFDRRRFPSWRRALRAVRNDHVGAPRLSFANPQAWARFAHRSRTTAGPNSSLLT